MTTDDMRRIAWVRRAAGIDSARPVLQGVHIADGTMMATCGHRMHFAPAPADAAEGIWRISRLGIEGPDSTWERIDGNSPDWRQIVSEAPANYRIIDLPGFLSACQDANQEGLAFIQHGEWFDEHGNVSAVEPISCLTASNVPMQIWASEEAFVTLNAPYLLDALVGHRFDREIGVCIGGPLDPVRIDLGDDRAAVLMPIRTNGSDRRTMYDLTPFVEATP